MALFSTAAPGESARNPTTQNNALAPKTHSELQGLAVAWVFASSEEAGCLLALFESTLAPSALWAS